MRLLGRGFHTLIKMLRSPLQSMWDLTIHPLLRLSVLAGTRSSLQSMWDLTIHLHLGPSNLAGTPLDVQLIRNLTILPSGLSVLASTCFSLQSMWDLTIFRGGISQALCKTSNVLFLVTVTREIIHLHSWVCFSESAIWDWIGLPTCFHSLQRICFQKLFSAFLWIVVSNLVADDVCHWYAASNLLVKSRSSFDAESCRICRHLIIAFVFCRANAQQPKLFVGMILILIFAEALALYGLIVGIILSSRAGQSRAD